VLHPSFLVFRFHCRSACKLQLGAATSGGISKTLRKRDERQARDQATRLSPSTQPRDGRSRNERVLRHLPLVRSIVYRLRPRPPALDVDDLISAGTIGLIEAVERFDSRRGVPFGTYAYTRIRGAIVDEIRRLPQPKRAGDDVELSLQAPIAGERSLTLIDVIPDPLAPEPEIGAEFGEVVDAIGDLPPREREVLGLHTAGHTIAEIAARFGCSTSRASQILIRARCRLQEKVV
jgi:RNA polymerase sigma factor (sigma-70 family)